MPRPTQQYINVANTTIKLQPDAPRESEGAPLPIDRMFALSEMFGDRATVPLPDVIKEPESYTARLKHLTKLDALYKGGEALDPYIPELIGRKFNEEAELYNRRVDLFAYHNHLQASIKELLTKFGTGSYVLQSQVETFSFIDDALNGKQFLIDCLKLAMRLGCVYVVSEPLLSQPAQTSAQRDKIAALVTGGLLQASEQRLTSVYTPFDALIASDAFYKFRRQYKQVDVHGDEFYLIEIRYIDSLGFYNFAYEFDGRSKYRNVGGSGWAAKHEVAIPVEYRQNYSGVMPVHVLKLSDDNFVAQQLAPLQVQYSRIHNAIVSNSHAAGHIQPWFKPLTGDGGLPTEAMPERTSSDYVIAADNFQIAETSGASTDGQMRVLDNIVVQIKQTAGLSGLSYSAKATESSGYSKEFELHSLEANLRTYGSLVVGFYQELLHGIGAQLGQPRSAECRVSGYDTFALDSSENTVYLLRQLKDAAVKLPKTARVKLMAKLCAQIDPNADDAESQAIMNELLAEPEITEPEPNVN